MDDVLIYNSANTNGLAPSLYRTVNIVFFELLANGIWPIQLFYYIILTFSSRVMFFKGCWHFVLYFIIYSQIQNLNLFWPQELYSGYKRQLINE